MITATIRDLRTKFPVLARWNAAEKPVFMKQLREIYGDYVMPAGEVKANRLAGHYKTGRKRRQRRTGHRAVRLGGVHGRALQIALQLTSRGGYRGFELQHIATALELGAKEFLTFDTQQSTLAQTVSFKVKP